MHVRTIFPAVLSAALLFTLVVPCAQAQPAGPSDTNRTVYSFSFSPIYQFESDFDRGGSFSVQRYGFNFDASKPVTNSLRAGISLGYDFEKYDFSGTTSFAGADPWSDIHRFSAGLPVSWRMTDSWSLFISPQVEWYGESGVDNWGDAFGYGAVFAVSYRVSPGLTLVPGRVFSAAWRKRRAFHTSPSTGRSPRICAWATPSGRAPPVRQAWSFPGGSPIAGRSRRGVPTGHSVSASMTAGWPPTGSARWTRRWAMQD